ncbi:uncharacterized protein YjbI with pentapeptide repeats [Caulobacter ginsengisoli]|uniref:Uncharacterized protein YjbI with pentapeptide repeats n=1 Tax=Caulobacter ginsengisoli TaxID=400775 RepID=A0ABU0IXN7_9CAUL|nr:pentapeptide repeat-containing protein [Caulobacter ginsengisoli]MDQ0466765.1 uncharacterized protein YjbI with pentapeptide repeats [Caulobacter ginsengisoli]
MSVRSLKTRVEARNVRMDPTRFQAMLRAHEAFALGKGGARALPRYVDLPDVRCDRRLLTDIDFTGSDLSGGSFVGADMTRASLYCANLSRCNFSEARLVRADLRGAAFTGAKLEAANLDGADMRAAVLCAADDEKGLTLIGALADKVMASLVGARLNGADLSDAAAFGVDFANASLRGARLRNANFKNARFDGANLDGADLMGARLAGARFQNAILTGVDVASLGLPPEALSGCLLDPTPEAKARLDDIRHELDQADRWVSTHGGEGHPAMLDGLDLRPAATQFAARLLAGLTARYSVAVGVSFMDAQLQGAVFDGADLRGADFSRADLRGASFRGANLSHAIFQATDLSTLGNSGPARFDGATLDGTGLVRAAKAPRDTVEI